MPLGSARRRVSLPMRLMLISPINDKSVEYDDRRVLKLSTGKETLAGKKQVFRISEGGRLSKDTIALRGESLEGKPMLRMAMKDGSRCQPQEPLSSIRDRFQEELMTLYKDYKVLTEPPTTSRGIKSGLAGIAETDRP